MGDRSTHASASVTPRPGDCWYDPGESSDKRVMSRHTIIFLEPHAQGGWLTLRVFDAGRMQFFHYPDEWVVAVYSGGSWYDSIRRIA